MTSVESGCINLFKKSVYRFMTGKKICLISGGHISSTPRLIKEADSLTNGGCEVLVLATQVVSSIVKFDEEVQSTRNWRVYHAALYDRSWLSRLIDKTSKRLARAHLFSKNSDLIDYARAVIPWYGSFLKQIEMYKPDLIIAHSIAGLLVAAIAKERMGIPFGFDVEDYHAAEREGGLKDFSNRLGFDVMKMCLPAASYVSVSSPQIEGEMRKHFRMAKTEVVLNCFPLQPLKKIEIKSPRISLYWFSQSLGMDRGLLDVLEACKELKGDFELHLRGGCSEEVRRILLKHALEGGYHDRFFLEPRCGADQLLSESMRHDVGLALELPSPLNRDLCITNKILMYSVAGLAIAATHTSGQRWVMDQMPEAGFTYDPGDFMTLRSNLQKWIDHPEILIEAKKMSRQAAESRFSWGHEELKFQRLMDSVFSL